jgi:hypothetical protein
MKWNQMAATSKQNLFQRTFFATSTATKCGKTIILGECKSRGEEKSLEKCKISLSKFFQSFK